MGVKAPGRIKGGLEPMPQGISAVEDSAMEVEYPPIVCEQPDDVVEVHPLEDYRLHVQFFDGTEGRVEMKDQILGPHAGAFSSLADPQEFRKVGVCMGAVTWANELDLAPDAMYQAFKQDGVWVLSGFPDEPLSD